MAFLTADVPKNWHTLRDRISDNFRIIYPLEFRVLKWLGYIDRVQLENILCDVNADDGNLVCSGWCSSLTFITTPAWHI
jgi:hypothetical protein